MGNSGIWILEWSYQVVFNFFFLFVLLISAHITIVEELCVPIRTSHIQPTSYYYDSKALCFILKYTALWLHNFLFL